MRLARNIAAAIANSIVVVLINLVAVPFYLRFLGMEAYGLIGFYATLQAVFQVLDLGLASTVSREIAHGAEVGAQRQSASLLRTLGVVYIAMALAIALVVALAAPWIGEQWLQAEALPANVVTMAVALMGVNLACRWPISLYHGALVGSHRLARSAGISMGFNIAAAATTIAMLAFGTRTIQAFFMVQAGFGLGHAVVLRILAHRAVGEPGAPYDFPGLKRVWRFSAWMTGIAATSLVFMHLDKVMLSRLVGLEEFGRYMLAVLLVSGLQVVVGPVFSVIYPKFTALLARGDGGGLARFYSGASRVHAAAVFSLALALALHAEAILRLWTGRADVAAGVAPLVAWLVIGSGLNGVMYFPYALQLADGRPRIPFAINAGLLVLAAPMIVWLAMRHGAMGAAMAWALLGAVYLLVGTAVTGAKIAPFAGARWLSRDILVPFLLVLVPSIAGAWVANAYPFPAWGETGIAALAAGIGMLLGAASSPLAREWSLAVFAGRRPCPQ